MGERNRSLRVPTSNPGSSDTRSQPPSGGGRVRTAASGKRQRASAAVVRGFMRGVSRSSGCTTQFRACRGRARARREACEHFGARLPQAQGACSHAADNDANCEQSPGCELASARERLGVNRSGGLGLSIRVDSPDEPRDERKPDSTSVEEGDGSPSPACSRRWRQRRDPNPSLLRRAKVEVGTNQSCFGGGGRPTTRAASAEREVPRTRQPLEREAHSPCDRGRARG